jgi:hypothetical protein
VNTPPALATRSTRAAEPVPTEGEVGLAELLELAHEEPAAASTSALRSLRSSGARLWPVTQEWSRRATEWGAGPQGAWRAW